MGRVAPPLGDLVYFPFNAVLRLELLSHTLIGLAIQLGISLLKEELGLIGEGLCSIAIKPCPLIFRLAGFPCNVVHSEIPTEDAILILTGIGVVPFLTPLGIDLIADIVFLAKGFQFSKCFHIV